MPTYYYFCPKCKRGSKTKGKVTQPPPKIWCCCSGEKIRTEYCGAWPNGLEKMKKRQKESK